MAERAAHDCPDATTLDDFVIGRVTTSTASRVEEHVASCVECTAKVRSLVSSRGPMVSPRAVELSATLPASSKGGEPEGMLGRGQRLGRYEILSIVGAGAMGVVYAALDPALDRRVAIKVMRREHDEPGDVLASRMAREGKAMARLSHPNVVAVYDVGEIDGRVFVAMELIEGRTLREWLGEKARSTGEVLDAFVAAGRGLAAAHEAGLVHRDFKPDNVLVRSDGRVCVTDFGLARLPDKEAVEASGDREVAARMPLTNPALTRSGALVGTPAYMAPEQLESVGADARSDVFAFCVALYEALYGQRPFAGGSLFELHANVRTGKIAPLSESARARVPEQVRAVLLEGLRPEPSERPATMTELLARLEKARVSAAAPPGSEKKRRGWVVAAGVVVAMGVVGVLSARARAPREAGAAGLDAANALGAGDACTSSKACVEGHGGAAYVCRAADHACVAIASEDCVAHAEASELASDDVVWLGAMFPTTGPRAEAYGKMNAEGAEFARREIAMATGPLGGANASMRVRRIGLVTCDDAANPQRAAKHLVDDVGVPAILGFGSGQELVDLAGSLLIRRGVLSVATLSPSPLITRVPQSPDLPQMVWRTMFSLDDVANATAYFVRDVVAPRAGGKTARVVLARGDAASPLSFAEAFYKRLSADGAGHDYHEVTFPNARLDDAGIGTLATRIVDAAPRILVLFDDEPSVAEAIEARWPAQLPRPTYLVPNCGTEVFAPFLRDSVERRRRFFTINSDSGSPTNARFVVRYNAAVHDSPATLTVNASPTYDAFYFLAYGTFALGDAPVTGPSLARAFTRLLPPGEPIEVGPTPLFDALKLLASGKSIDLEGAASHLDFERTTGEAPSDFSLNCATVDATGRANGEVESGVHYRVKTAHVEGTLRCP